MKPILCGIVTVIMAMHLCGTEQMGERLIYGGVTNRMDAEPVDGQPLFELFLNEKSSIPKKYAIGSTGCRRGYVGTWMITNRTLCLVAFGRPMLVQYSNDCYRQEIHDISIGEVFKGWKLPKEATWYTGMLRIPPAAKRSSPYEGYVYDNYLLIWISEGKVIAEGILTNNVGETQSYEDLRWCALSCGKQVEDNTNWYDARVIGTTAFRSVRESSAVFVTRGIYFMADGSACLWIPETRSTEGFSIDIDPQPISCYRHVEISAHFMKDTNGFRLVVDSIRPLEPGETIHRPDFVPPKK